MRNLTFKTFLPTVVLSVLLIGAHGAQGFNLNKMMQGLEVPTSAPPKSNKEKPADFMGGLLGGMKQTPGGFPSGSKSGVSSGSESSGKDYTKGSIIPFLCQKTKDPKELYSESSDETLKEWQIRVAKDFGKKTAPEVQAIFNEWGAKSSLGWAKNLKFYLAKGEVGGAFSGVHMNRLIENFADKSDMRGQLAGKIKQAMSDENLDEKDRVDAKFAYSLILGHYNTQHKRQGYAEGLLKAAYDAEVLGALYVWGLRMYEGYGVPKNINGAANFVANASRRVQDLDEEAQENGEDEVERWPEPDNLWNRFATDPRYEGHDRYKSLSKMGAKVRASLEKAMKKNTGTKTQNEIKELEKIRKDAEKRLRKAFGIADQIAEEANDLKNISSEKSFVIKKTRSVSEKASLAVAKQIATTEKDLNPKGLKAVASAHDRVRYVVGQSGRLLSSFMAAPLAGGFGELINTTISVGKSLNLACQLNNAIVVYKEKKELKIDVSENLEKKDDTSGME